MSRQECFAWMATWQRAPTHTIAGMMELYEQMLTTKVYPIIRSVPPEMTAPVGCVGKEQRVWHK